MGAYWANKVYISLWKNEKTKLKEKLPFLTDWKQLQFPVEEEISLRFRNQNNFRGQWVKLERSYIKTARGPYNICDEKKHKRKLTTGVSLSQGTHGLVSLTLKKGTYYALKQMEVLGFTLQCKNVACLLVWTRHSLELPKRAQKKIPLRNQFLVWIINLWLTDCL